MKRLDKYKIGDLVMFPCESERYTYQPGILMGFHDNPADVRDWEMKKKRGVPVPGYCADGPRQVADVLYKGRMDGCWAHSLRQIIEEPQTENLLHNISPPSSKDVAWHNGY